MTKYVLNLNQQPNNNNNFEIHSSGCTAYFPRNNILDLGEHVNCLGAMERAKSIAPSYVDRTKIDGCATCCEFCNSDKNPGRSLRFW